MTNQFREYARYYDLLYRDKDYAGESSFVSRLLNRFVGKQPAATTILDLACGTGRHVQELSRMGYSVSGADISQDMVAVARENAERLGLGGRFYNESFQSCDRIAERYDAVTAMFSAINYLTEYSDLSRALCNIRALLRKGGSFIFDFWNGNAVIRSYSPVRVKRVKDGDDEVIRISKTSVDAVAQIATIEFNFMLMKAGVMIHEFSEVHPIRYFFPQEMADLLTANGFIVIHRCPFLRENDSIEPDDWNLTYVARPCE